MWWLNPRLTPSFSFLRIRRNMQFQFYSEAENRNANCISSFKDPDKPKKIWIRMEWILIQFTINDLSPFLQYTGTNINSSLFFTAATRTQTVKTKQNCTLFSPNCQTRDTAAPTKNTARKHRYAVCGKNKIARISNSETGHVNMRNAQTSYRNMPRWIRVVAKYARSESLIYRQATLWALL
jgi:hypothetical protein